MLKHSQVLHQLLKAGAKLDYQGGENKNSALHICCQNGDLRSVKVILDYCTAQASDQDTLKLLYLRNK
jgi:ankyrin repeat protein